MFARWTTLAILATFAGPASAADTEQRVFDVSVDGKPSGEFRLTVRTADDGTETATAVANVKVAHLFGGYRYRYRGTEVWANGRLRRFDANSDDNGKKHTVSAEAADKSTRVTVDGATRTARPNMWPTSYWRMPAGLKQGQTVVLLDADTGEEQEALIDTARPLRDVRVMDRPGNVFRVHIIGPNPVELWFDDRGRLVQQESIEDGHKTVLTLREIQK